jgi:WD40 repeat protein
MQSARLRRHRLNAMSSVLRLPLLITTPGIWAEPQAGSARPELMVQLGHSGPILCSTFSPDEKYLLTGGLDYTARLWDVATGKEIRRFLGNREPVDMVSFLPDGRRIVTHSDNGPLILWERDTGRTLRRFEGKPNSDPFFQFSPDGTWLLTVTGDGDTNSWDALTGEHRGQLGRHGGPPRYIEFSPENERAILTFERAVLIWNIKARRIEDQTTLPTHKRYPTGPLGKR